MELCQAWVRRLLVGASGLTALSIHMHTIPCSPMLQHLPLRHLEVIVSFTTMYWSDGFLGDVSRCRTLESLAIIFSDGRQARGEHSIELPSMYLHGMPRLKHVRLNNCLPGNALTLPANCLLFLDDLHTYELMWEMHWDQFQRHTTIMRLDYTDNPQWLHTDDPQWPEGIQLFSNLRYLELKMHQVCNADLATLQGIPHVRIIMNSSSNLQLTAGSWETLELFHFGRLRVSMSDMNSFVRDTRDFTFLTESPRSKPHGLVSKLRDACFRQGKACYVRRRHHKHCGEHGVAYDKKVTYVVLSTNKEMAENFRKGIPVICNCDKAPKVSFGRGETLADWQDFWPRDPCDLVKRT